MHEVQFYYFVNNILFNIFFTFLIRYVIIYFEGEVSPCAKCERKGYEDEKGSMRKKFIPSKVNGVSTQVLKVYTKTISALITAILQTLCRGGTVYFVIPEISYVFRNNKV